MELTKAPNQLTVAEVRSLAQNTLSETASMARSMYQGDHLGLLSKAGMFAFWRGPVFTLDENLHIGSEEAKQATKFVTDFQNALKRSFTSTNLVREVLDREVGASLARMTWEADPKNNRLLGMWWKTRNTHPERVIREVITTARREGRACLRFVFSEPPKGLERTPEALTRYLRLESIPPEQSCVFEDPSTLTSVGVFAYQKGGQEAAELSYLDERGHTVIKVMDSNDEKSSDALDLGGRLTIIEISLPALITLQVLQNQMGYNTVSTLALRNTELAGFVERYGVNLSPPYVLEPDPKNPGQMIRRYLPVKVGSGTMNFWAQASYDKVDGQGRYVGEEPMPGGAQYGRLEPTSADPLLAAANLFKTNLYGEVGQAFVLMSSDATATGRSREVSMSDFDARREVTQDAGRYLIGVVGETALALLYALAGKPAPEVQIIGQVRGRAIPQAADERAADLADMAAGVMNVAEVRARRGLDEETAQARASPEVNTSGEG